MELRDEEIWLGHFSEAFSELSSGMTTIPLWVVPKPHSEKSHLLVDHSAGEYSPLGDAPLHLTFPPIFLRHLCIFLLIVASPRRSALTALIPESDGHVT